MPTLTQLFSVPNNEVLAAYVTEDGRYLYYNHLYGTDPNNKGRIIKRDLVTGNETIIFEKSRFAAWNSVYVAKDNKIYFFGEADDDQGVLRSTVVIVDLNDDSVVVVQHPNTGDCNEFIGVAYDEKNDRFIVGERKGGAVTTGSSWPNGGGLWIIPRSTITDPSTWQRVHEFSPLGSESINPGVTKVLIAGNNVFVTLTGASTRGIQKASLDDLTTWTSIEQGDSFARNILGNGDIIAYAKESGSNTLLIRYSTDNGETWNEYDTGIDLSTDKGSGILLYGKYVIVIHAKVSSHNPADVYLVDLENQTTQHVGSLTTYDMLEGTARHENVFFTNRNNSTSYIYKLTFDTPRRLSLSTNKQTANAGEVITLTATLTDDQGNPVSGEIIEFYVVRCGLSRNAIIGEKIGTATTDENGQATINYTLPTTPGKVWFRAIYKG